MLQITFNKTTDKLCFILISQIIKNRLYEENIHLPTKTPLDTIIM